MCKRYIDRFSQQPQPGTWPTTQACALTGNRTHDLPVCRLALNPLSHTSQGQCFPRCALENLKARHKTGKKDSQVKRSHTHRPCPPPQGQQANACSYSETLYCLRVFSGECL